MPLADSVPKPAEKHEKAQDVWGALHYLEQSWPEHYDGALWDFAPNEFLPLLESWQQQDLVRLAKAAMPWLAAIIEVASKGVKAA